MQDYEKLGQFYLGKQFNLKSRQPDEDLVLYDAKDLCTHAVCVGMTGSGKTGLCLTLLEEAAIDGIPAICIDPKGDLGNLMLTFPDLKPNDFKPWLEQADATRKGLTVDEYAARTAQQWKEGLAAWGQEPSRIQKFRDAVEIAIYTPGSTAGIPLTVLRSFNAPPESTLKNSEALRERIAASVSGLLALMGVEADPLRSREHILLSNLLDRAWKAGRDLDLGSLIRDIQTPPFQKLGYLDLESFFPAKDRFSFAMSLNNLVASPGFAAWTMGEPLDVQRLYYTPEGKPRLSIISIAHLTDAERMFFVTILLNEIIGWMRSQSGTSSLRAILYMDEIFGYFPPTANPPSKTPLLTLMKQARAFGLGVTLATQNPVDIDYKGLSNAGTWFLGRLQTERDKLRVLDGLEGATAAAGKAFDRAAMEQILSGLGNRVFLMNNVHEDQPIVFQSRWALSFLRGPLTRDQIASLMETKKLEAAANAIGESTGFNAHHLTTDARPVLPPDVPETFLCQQFELPQGTRLVYRPAIFAQSRTHFVQAANKVDYWERLSALLPIQEPGGEIDWEHATIQADADLDVEAVPVAEAAFESLPAGLTRPKRYAELATALRDVLYRTRKLSLWKASELKETSQPGETEGDFRVRLAQSLKERRDLEIEKLRAKFMPKLQALQESRRKAEQRLAKEKEQANSQTLSAAISMGTTILGAMFGRKLASAANVTKVATSAKAASRVLSERQDVGRKEEDLQTLQQREDDLNSQFQQEVEKLRESADTTALELVEIVIPLKKSDISIERVCLLWTPWSVAANDAAEPLYEWP